jgi:hypothetical protein
MKIKVSELEGAALDWAVAKAINAEAITAHMDHWSSPVRYSPSTIWSQGGRLIEVYDVGVCKMGSGEWCAAVDSIKVSQFYNTGLTALIAVCRAIVLVKLGETVEVPDELITHTLTGAKA